MTERRVGRRIGGRAAAAPGPAALGALLGAAALAGCGSDGAAGRPPAPGATGADRPAPVAGEVWRPAPGTSWQIQLSGPLDTSFDVDMYDVDLFDTPAATIGALRAAGRRVVCYFSAGSLEDWRPDADAFPERVLGRPLVDWPGERWLDVRAFDVLGPIMEARLDLAVAKGCDGVEPDNVDAHANASGLPLTADDQLLYNRYLADAAHARGLSVGLKNDLDQLAELEPWFDWALNERCAELGECARLAPFVAAGKAVFGIEYAGDPATLCPRANALDLDVLIKSRELDAARTSCR